MVVSALLSAAAADAAHDPVAGVESALVLADGLQQGAGVQEAHAWTTDVLTAQCLYSRLGLEPRGLSKKLVNKVAFHIIANYSLDENQRRAVILAQEVLTDTQRRKNFDELYKMSYNVVPRGRLCWKLDAGKVVPLTDDVTPPRADGVGARPTTFTSWARREQLFQMGRDTKKPKWFGEGTPPSDTKARIRPTYQWKLDWLCRWDGFCYELPDGRVLSGDLTEDSIITYTDGRILPTYLGRWAEECRKERWPEWSAKELSHKGMTEEIRRNHGLDGCRKGPKCKHPAEWSEELGKDLEKHIKGAAPPSTAAIAKSWVSLKEQKNSEVREQSRANMAINVEALQQFASGELALEDAREKALELPQEYHGNAGCSWITGFREKQGFNTVKVPRASRKELADDDPTLVEQRERIRRIMEEEGIPFEMVANADQIWRTRGRLNHKNVLGVNAMKRLRRVPANPELSIDNGPLSNGKMTYQAVATAEHDTWKGCLRPTEKQAQMDLDWFQRLKEKHASYEEFDRCLRLMGAKAKPRRKSRFAQSGETRVELPSNARAPRTLITFGWMDGTPGKLQVQYGEGDISNKDVEWANSDYSEVVRVRCLEKRSHMCDAECIIEWLDTEVREGFRNRRKYLNHDHEVKGMLLLDAGPAHIAWKQGEALRRDELCQELNIKLVFLKPGSSAHGQPMDQLHNILRHYSYKHEKLTLGHYDNIYSRKAPEDMPRTEAGNLVGLTNRQSILGDLWAMEKMPQHMWLLAWHMSGYLTEQEMNDIAKQRWGMDMQEQKAIWQRVKKDMDALREDQIDLEVVPRKSNVDIKPFEAEVQNVYQVGELGSGQGWRTLHQGLQFALKREFARRRYQVSNQAELKITDADLQKRAVASLVFLGEREILETRVRWLEKSAAVKPMLTYVTVHLDDMVLTPSSGSLPLPLRVVPRRLREALHQNEPPELPESDAVSWTLAAHYGLDHERPVPRLIGMARGPAPRPVGGEGAGAEAECGLDEGGEEAGVAGEPELSLDVVEANELKNLRALQKRRREAQSAALRQAAVKRKEDAGWILTASGTWMYPGIVNRAWALGLKSVPPRYEAKPIGAGEAQPAGPSAAFAAPSPVAVPPAEPAADKPDASADGPPAEYMVTVPIKMKWLIPILQGLKKTEYRKVGWYKPRLLKPGRLATKLRLEVGKGSSSSAFAVLRIAKCEVISVSSIPAGEAPEPGTPEHAEVFGGESEVLAVHLGELLGTSPGLRESYLGAPAEALPVVPGCPLEWVASSVSATLADKLLAGGGWHLWHTSLAAAVGTRLAVAFGGQALGSVQVLQAAPVGATRPRAGGYKWAAVKDRESVDKASFKMLMDSISDLEGAPEAHAVQVSGCARFSPTALASEGLGFIKIAELQDADQLLLRSLEGGQSPDLEPFPDAGYRCVRLSLVSGFVPLIGCGRFASTSKGAASSRVGVLGCIAQQKIGLTGLSSLVVITKEIKGNQNIEVAPNGYHLNTLCPDGPFTAFARAACVSIQFAFASRVFRAEVDAEGSLGFSRDEMASGAVINDLLGGTAPMASIIMGTDLHNSFVVDRFLVDPLTGKRGDEEAAKDQTLLKNYYATPRMILDYIKVVQRSGWELIFCDALLMRELTAEGVPLMDALVLVDKHVVEARLPVFILVGSGKSFSITRVGSSVLSFDSHQRSRDGVFREETCVGQAALSAACLYGSLVDCYGGGVFDVYVLWR